MKKMTTYLCVLLLALVLPIAARADVIYQPFDDFYFTHMEQCEYVCRSYTANGPNGTVTLYTDPVTPVKEAECPNGTALYVSYIYEADDSILWGCCEEREEGIIGWAPMEYLELIYDGISFAEEYGDQFVDAEVIPDHLLVIDNMIWFWLYPGCTDPFEVTVSTDNMPACYRTYTDEAGNLWGQCGYHYGIKNHWINLSNPSADYATVYPDIPEETEPPETKHDETEEVPEIKPDGGNLFVAVSFAVAAVVIVTGLLLIVLKKKKA